MINPEIEKDYIVEKLAGTLQKAPFKMNITHNIPGMDAYSLHNDALKNFAANRVNPSTGKRLIDEVPYESLAEYALRKGKAE